MAYARAPPSLWVYTSWHLSAGACRQFFDIFKSSLHVPAEERGSCKMYVDGAGHEQMLYMASSQSARRYMGTLQLWAQEKPAQPCNHMSRQCNVNQCRIRKITQIVWSWSKYDHLVWFAWGFHSDNNIIKSSYKWRLIPHLLLLGSLISLQVSLLSGGHLVGRNLNLQTTHFQEHSQTVCVQGSHHRYLPVVPTVNHANTGRIAKLWKCRSTKS